jgi:TfdA family taurine catabolism dioxygenase TauD
MLQTRQLHPTLAREVVELRPWEPLDDATVAELRALYAAFGVLVFRRQALNEAELAAFCGLFGPLERTVRSDWASITTPEVTSGAMAKGEAAAAAHGSERHAVECGGVGDHILTIGMPHRQRFQPMAQFRPAALAAGRTAASQACVRSRVRARSNSAKAANK